MTWENSSCVARSRFAAHLRDALDSYPRSRGSVVLAQTPAVVDVMGGIGEDSGSLVLTATLGLSFTMAMWPLREAAVRLRLITQGGSGPALDYSAPLRVLGASPAPPDATVTPQRRILEHCREVGCQWAAPTCLALHQAQTDALVPKLEHGLMVLLQSDFPPDADFGRHSAQATAAIDGLCKLFGSGADRLRKSRTCASALEPMTGLRSLRAAMTALGGPADGALLQLRFHPQMLCQALELPAGVVVVAARTRLSRPVTLQRLIETRDCAEMGTRMIKALQKQDGLPQDRMGDRLAAITPAEYVERYRDRLPSKIKGKTFIEKFGALRGLNGELDPENAYKVRSRSEHHIYENRRVHEFATDIVRARRNGDWDALVRAGELMYASHWSHSQRCGIGGVESDRLVSCIRKHGASAGLFGAKVTAGGAGGELAVLMRDDERARAALADAITSAEAATNQAIHTYMGSLPGADFFQPPQLEELIAQTGPV